MPGRSEPLLEFVQAALLYEIDAVVCLAERDELDQKSPEYAKLVESNTAAWKQLFFPIPDFGVPTDKQKFLVFSRTCADEIEAGRRVLIHCGAGIGRTGTLAALVLMQLSAPITAALRSVKAAGSHPETLQQYALVEWAATKLA